MQLPAPNCQVMSFISSKLIFPKIRITFRVFQWAGSYGNAITGLIPADLFEKKHTKRLQNYGKKLQNVLLFFSNENFSSHLMISYTDFNRSNDNFDEFKSIESPSKRILFVLLPKIFKKHGPDSSIRYKKFSLEVKIF